MEQYVKQLHELDEKISSIRYSMALVSWDSQTIAPKRSVNGRAKAMMTLSDIYFSALINENTEEMIQNIEPEVSKLSDDDQMKFRLYKESYDEIAKIPQQEYIEFSEAKSLSAAAWEKAKNTDDYALFAPHLEKMIKYTKRSVDYMGKSNKRYDVLLDRYEKDLTMENVDKFFAYLKSEIVPLVNGISNVKMDNDFDFLNKKFNIKSQKQLVLKMIDFIGFDFDRGLVGESEHPFTCNINRDDVRFSIHYYKNDFRSAILSAFHEGGHALYEQNVDSKYANSILGTGTSMGIHESQSRFYENHIALSETFLKTFYKTLKKDYKSIVKDVSFKDFNLGMNKVSPSLIRIEADEVTYPLHVMIRYELEKHMIENDVEVNELPQLWNEKYREYLGVVPKNNREGILQDVHWSEALFGYFPSYALGSAYSTQFYKAMSNTVEISGDIQKGDLSKIKEWLKLNVHRYGSAKTPKEIIEGASGEAFNPKYYTQYIKEKYSKLYNL